jgi:hypothetical protein
MTLLKPTLKLNSLSVSKDSRSVLEIQFHEGVNVVRGHNSSGKTTVMDFIAYGLGAENIPWKPEAELCDQVLVEVELNGRRVVLRRSISPTPLAPMFVYWGSAGEANSAPPTAWEVYPFRRSASKISFTQALLVALDMPEAQGDGASNLTMHQFLRVLYADQPSLHSPIFRNDTFDSALTRETVGNYLCGIYDDRLYTIQLERRTLEKDIAVLDSELRSIFRVLATSRQDVNFEFISEQLKAIEKEQEVAAVELASLKKMRALPIGTVRPEQGTLREQLNEAKAELTATQDRLTRRELEAADSVKFIEEIEHRLASIEESKATRDYFGGLAISYCPCCLAEILPSAVQSEACPLCKSPVRNTSGDAQVLRMKNELRIQLRESEALKRQADEEITQLRALLPGKRARLTALEAQYKQGASLWSSEVETAIEELSRKLGRLEQEVKSLQETQRLGSVIAELKARRAALSERESSIDSEVERLGLLQEQRKKKVSALVAETLGRLLREDVYRQEEFRSAENIQFNFVDNSVSVQGATQFSESSTVVLRHLFHVSLLSAADKITEMRLPRFMMLDGIEDGGMELARAHHLQEIIVAECESFTHDYQLILATSQIAPSIDRPEYVVGRYFSETERSLTFTAPRQTPQVATRS